MHGEQPVDARWPVLDVIDSLLRAALPPELHALLPRLARECAAREFVSAHVQKRWGELSEGEGNLIAREVGLVARGVLSGVPSTSSSHLH